MVPDESYALNEEIETLGVLVLRLKQRKPDSILIDLNKRGAAYLFKRMIESKLHVPVLGVSKVKYVFLHGLIATEALKFKVSLYELPISDSFAKQYRDEFNEAPGIFSDTAYDGVMILAQAVAKTDGSTEKVRHYLRHELNYQGVSGSFSYDEAGNLTKAGWQIRQVS